MRLNGAAEPARISGAAALTWAHRSRTQQTAYVALQHEGDIGPEAGTTYTVRAYGEAGALVRTVTGLTGTAWTYALAQEIADSGLGRANAQLTFEIESVRDGVESWQPQRIGPVVCAGYGMDYGADWGD